MPPFVWANPATGANWAAKPEVSENASLWFTSSGEPAFRVTYGMPAAVMIGTAEPPATSTPLITASGLSLTASLPQLMALSGVPREAQ